MSIRFSIITVVKNGEDTLERTIRSIACQKEINTEYIIIDGDSQDGTKEIVKKYKNVIDHYINEKDNGIYDAMNKGIRIAKGEILAFLNSGDWYVKDALRIIDKNFKKDDDIIYGLVRRVTDGKPDGYIGIKDNIDFNRLYLENLFCHQGMFIKRELFHRLGGFDPNYNIVGDWEWNIRALVNGVHFRVLNVDIAYYLSGGISEKSLKKVFEEAENIHLKYALNYKNKGEEALEARQKIKFRFIYNEYRELLNNCYDKGYKYYIWGAGKNGQKCLRLLEQSDIVPEAFIDNAKDKAHFGGIDVLCPEEALNRLQTEKGRKKIIITPEGFEEEIKDRINEWKIEECESVTFMNSLNEVLSALNIK